MLVTHFVPFASPPLARHQTTDRSAVVNLTQDKPSQRLRCGLDFEQTASGQKIVSLGTEHAAQETSQTTAMWHENGGEIRFEIGRE